MSKVSCKVQDCPYCRVPVQKLPMLERVKRAWSSFKSIWLGCWIQAGGEDGKFTLKE